MTTQAVRLFLEDSLDAKPRQVHILMMKPGITQHTKNAAQLQPNMRENRAHGFGQRTVGNKIKTAGGCAISAKHTRTKRENTPYISYVNFIGYIEYAAQVVSDAGRRIRPAFWKKDHVTAAK